MRMRAILTLLIGIALASGSVFVASRYLSDRTVNADLPRMELSSVVVAYTDIPFGEPLRPESLRERTWPADARPEGSFRSIEDLLGDGSEPRVALRPIDAGEPILEGKVSGFGGRATLSTLLPHGKRAFSIKIDAVTGVSGFLLPGDRVDVLLTRRLDDELRTDIVLQNMMVRAIDQLSNESRDKPQVARTVTLEASPEEAQKLALASSAGSLTLALRNTTSGDELTKVRAIRVKDLVPEEKAQQVVRSPQVRVRRSGNVTWETVR